MRDSIQIEEIAADWLARRDGEDWSEADRAELAAWLDSSTAHRIAYIRLEAAWQQARHLKALAAGLACGELCPPRDGPYPPIPRRQLPAVADFSLAASSGPEPTEQ
jgi:transmembrane sensor